MKTAYCVYRIYNICNNRFQVGPTCNLSIRKKEHLRKLRINIHSCKTLQNAWNKYGEESFIWLIESTHQTRQEAYDSEQKWIDQFYQQRCCYNENLSATKPPISQKGQKRPKHSEDTKRKMSIAHMGKQLDANVCKKISMSNILSHLHERKRFILFSPQKEKVLCVGIRATAKKYQLNIGNLSSLLSGKRLSCNGWRLYYDK